MNRIVTFSIILFTVSLISCGNKNSRYYTLQTDTVKLSLKVTGDTILLENLEDKTIEKGKYMQQPSPFFSISCGKGKAQSSAGGIKISNITYRKNRKISIMGLTNDSMTGFTFVISLRDDAAADIDFCISDLSNKSQERYVTLPDLHGFVNQGARREMWGMIPQETGNIVPLEPGSPPIGMASGNRKLPAAMNCMEVCAVYDYDNGNGFYIADAGSRTQQQIAPIQLSLAPESLRGVYSVLLAPGEHHDLPTMMIGVFSQAGWRRAIDKYVERNARHWKVPDIPAWFRDKGAIYNFSGEGSGAIYMKFPRQPLATRINDFDELPKLLDEAEALGTNILYLWDYWEHNHVTERLPYTNKGDYQPSIALGGANSLKRGIQAVHDRGGRIIAYVEPFITSIHSKVGRAIGEETAARSADGRLLEFYGQTYTMNPCSPVWRAHLTRVTQQLIGEYGFDGIFLDSYCWQMNRGIWTREFGRYIPPGEYTSEVYSLIETIRNTAREIKSDAIVMGETTAGPVWQYWDGGLSADFAWVAKRNRGRLAASPVRYGIPYINYYTNGTDRAEMNQVFAAGHNLALVNENLKDSTYVRKLVNIRQTYKDALIYGKLLYQPWCHDPTIASYRYSGGNKELLVIVNTSKINGFEGTVRLQPQDTTKWKLLFGGFEPIQKEDMIDIRLQAGELLIFTQY